MFWMNSSMVDVREGLSMYSPGDSPVLVLLSSNCHGPALPPAVQSDRQLPLHNTPEHFTRVLYAVVQFCTPLCSNIAVG